MKYVLVLFCLLTSISFAQKGSFSLKAPLNLVQGKNLVDTNPVFKFSSEEFSDLINFLQRKEMDNLPIDIIVNARGRIDAIQVTNIKDLQTFMKVSSEETNAFLNQFIGTSIVEMPAYHGNKPVGFYTTIVLFLNDGTITLNPILHN